jgi:hypothetical protein
MRTLFSEVNKKSPLSFCRLRRQTALLVRSMQRNEDDDEGLRRKTVHETGADPLSLHGVYLLRVRARIRVG